MPFDVRLGRMLRDPGDEGSGVVRRGASLFNSIGQPGVLVASLVMYGTGQLSSQPQLTKFGAHATEAVVISGAATMLIKIAAGRQRPYLDHDDPYVYEFGGGLEAGRTSLPSGHATAAFAFASVVSADLQYWRPDVARIAVPLLYAGAATVGLARIYSDRHWASDVVLGAGIGTIVGRVIALNAHANPDNWLDRQLRAVTILPAAYGGVMVGAHYTFGSG